MSAGIFNWSVCLHASNLPLVYKDVLLQVVKMLVIVLLTFVVCWMPNVVFIILNNWHIIARNHRGVLVRITNSQEQAVTLSTTLITFVNSAFNPVLYAILSR